MVVTNVSAKGVAYTFFTMENAPRARELISVLEEAKQTVDPQLYELSTASGYGMFFFFLFIPKNFYS